MPHNPDDDRKDVEQAPGPRGEVYLEYKQVGQTMKVTAIDAATGVEVVIMGPASTAQCDLQALALRKLKMKLEKDEAATDSKEKSGSEEEGGPKGWIA